MSAALVLQVEHRLGDRAPSAAVVGDDRVDRVALDVAVDEHDGDPTRAASGQGHPERRRDVDKPVDRGAVDEVRDVPLERCVGAFVEEHGAVAGERELVVEDPQKLGVEGVRDVRDDQADGSRPARDQAARGEVRRVVHLPRRLEDPRLRLRGHARVAAQRPRDGRLADVEPAGDVLARDGHGGSIAEREDRGSSSAIRATGVVPG